MSVAYDLPCNLKDLACNLKEFIKNAAYFFFFFNFVAGTLEVHSPVAYTWEVVGDDCMSVPCGDTFITFQVKSCRDGHILLMQDNSTNNEYLQACFR